MESYRTLYRIAVVHDYFNGQPCTALQCHLARQGSLLARQRGLLFRQTAADEWAVLYDSNGAGPDTANDVLVMEISLADLTFPLYTEWKGLRPAAAYVLELPRPEESIDATSAILLDKNGRRKVGTPFCTVFLRLTQQLLEAAKANKPERALLYFHAPEVLWEYLFLPRGESGISIGGLVLEDTTGRLGFSAFEECKAYGMTAWRTVSQERIPMRTSYECRLRLVAQAGDRQQKRILLSRISPPDPGRYRSGQGGIIRQVCYF